jgi:hypothetical protein
MVAQIALDRSCHFLLNKTVNQQEEDRMSEQQPIIETQGQSGEEERKLVVFAVRVDPVFRDQVEGLRGITGQSVNEVGVEALNDWVAKTLADDAVREKAMAEIDAEARKLEERRASIAGILGNRAAEATPRSDSAEPGRSASKTRKATSSDDAVR